MSNTVVSTVSDSTVDALIVVTDTLMEAAEVIPVFGKILQIARASRSVADALFVNKVETFLKTFSRLSSEQRNLFIDQLRAKGEAERFGQALLLMLDKADEADKPMVLGRLFCAAAQDKISLDMAKRLGAIVNRGYFADLLHLEEFQKENNGSDREIAVALRSLGLLEITAEDFFDPSLTAYRLNKYGLTLLQFGLRDQH